MFTEPRAKGATLRSLKGLLGDDIVDSAEPCIGQMMRIFERRGKKSPCSANHFAAAGSHFARDQLEQAFERAQRLLGRRSAARRSELAEGLQELADAVDAALRLPPEASPADGTE